MYRTTLRSASRPALRNLRSSATSRTSPFLTSQRFASTASPASKPRSWKSSALRLGLAVGAVYYYTTSPVFAEQPAVDAISAPSAFDDSDLPTVDSVIEQKRKEISARLEKKKQQPKQQDQQQQSATKPDDAPSQHQQSSSEPSQGGQQSPSTIAVQGSPEALEEEAGQQGAFNPETGEINWDCPCLGGMAHGPCGEEFKTAFSCFVYSDEEPKGMDCIDKFQGMQDCFRKYPEVYGSELTDDEAETIDNETQQAAAAPATADTPAPAIPAADADISHQQIREHPPTIASGAAETKLETHNLPGVKTGAEVENAIPTKWEDATAANDEVKEEEKPEEKKE